MKSLMSIPLIILILFTGINVKFATHYCGGYVYSTKVSLTGELATCGMESGIQKSTQEESVRKPCCDDVTSAYSINNNYFSSSYSVNDPAFQVISTFIIPVGLICSQETIIQSLNKTVRPPGTNQPNSVDRPVLCIFRI